MESPTTDSPNYKAIVSSVPFKFIVGLQEREFYIHSGLVAAQSQTLSTLVNGPMKEGTEKCAVWPDTDEDTFARFAMFAYTGDYDGLEKINLCKDNSASVTDSSTAPESKKKAKKRHHNVYYNYDGPPSCDEPEPLLPKIGCPDSWCTHETATWADGHDIFMVHARVYVFADFYNIGKLRVLALRKLHRLIVQFTVTSETSGVVINLARYTYENTRQTRSDFLRAMVSRYCASALLKFRDDPEVDALIRQTPDLSADIIQSLQL